MADAATRWEAARAHRAAYCRGARPKRLLAGGEAAGAAEESLQDRLARASGSAPHCPGPHRAPRPTRADHPRHDRQHRHRPAASVVADDLGLTAREVEVLAELALGRTDRQIADELFISKKTVSVHVSNILRKLDATNRIDAAEIGQRAGLNLASYCDGPECHSSR